jgi:hypothetical protein
MGGDADYGKTAAAPELQVAEIEASIGRSDYEEAIRLVGALQLPWPWPPPSRARARMGRITRTAARSGQARMQTGASCEAPVTC